MRFCLLIYSLAAVSCSCPSGQYEEGGACMQCPEHTVTATEGHATSLHDCRCMPGFICMYYRQVHATVTLLNTTMHDFEQDHDGVRSNLLSGIAAAARVSTAQVHVHFVVVRLNHRRRALLSIVGHGIQVSLLVSGTSVETLSALRRHLSGLQTRGDSWEVLKRVLVLAIPAHQKELAVAVEQNLDSI